jgi:hypothetical protein
VTGRAGHDLRAVLHAVLPALVLLAAPAARGAERRWIGAAEVGFDSYMERYTVADDDTLSSIAEFYARLRLGYAVGALGRSYALLEGKGLLGESSYEAGGHAVATRRFGAEGRHALHVDLEAGRRGYRPGSQYDFPNGYLRAVARGTLRWRASDGVLLKLDERVERVDYDERTEFDYDFTRNAATASADVAGGLTHTFTVGMRLTTMSVPDSSEIDYQALTPLVEYRSYVDAHRRVQVTMGAERRLYAGDATRSSFWALLGSGFFEWALSPQWSFELNDEVEHYIYDEQSGAYATYLRNLAEVLLNFNRGNAQIGAGPAFGWVDSRESPQDEYRELGAKITFEWMGGTGAWVAASYQPGWRDYLLYDSPSASQDAIFSDYGYHRVDVFATVRLRGSVWLNVYADYQPEDHDRAGDDATATVASLSVTSSF